MTTHAPWQAGAMWKDWTNALLGFWLAISPWFVGGAAHRAHAGMVGNCVLTGGLIVVFAVWAVRA